MLRLVIGLTRKAARQIGVITVFVEFALGIRGELVGAVERDRRVASDPGAIGLGQQATRLAQVLSLDGDEFRIAIQAGRLDILSFGAAQVTALEQPNSAGELALSFVPQLWCKFGCAGVGRVLPAFHDLR